MSYSYDFCINRVSDSNCSDYSNLDWTKAEEYNYESLYINRIPDGRYNYDDDDIIFNVKYNPNGDFQYFTSFQFVHDGTLLFISYGVQNLINRIYSAATYNKLIGEPQKNKIASYIYGNPVILNEYGAFGAENKPWLLERTTILIPIEYHLEDKE